MRTPRQWWQDRTRARRRRRKALANRDVPLREFVYLDEVSVYSLLSSRIGALATEFTDSEESSLTAEVRSQVSAGTPLAKGQVGSAVKTGQTTGSQVLRRATVQSTFREFDDYIRHELKLSADLGGAAPSVDDASDLVREAGKNHGWVVDASTMSRGDLLEVEVELDADDAFRASTTLTTLFAILRDLQQLRSNMGEAITAMRVLEGLLAGVVPVRGRAVNYFRVVADGRDLVVRREICEQLADQVRPLPIEVVGICEADLFWRDLRRVVFSSSQYRMLCRLGKDGLARDWNPVKLTDVLEGVVPGLRDIIDQLPSMLARVKAQEDDGAPSEQMRSALESYAIELARGAGRELTIADLERLGIPTADQNAAYENFKDRRAAFAEVTEALEAALEIETNAIDAARLRSRTLADARVIDVQDAETGATETGTSTSRAVRYLDSEIIAIFW